jgi:CheY-like chemotaxis protein
MSTKKVLIAEDSSVLQNLIKKVITYLPDFDVSMVKNGKQVLEITKTEKFDVILMDINIPFVDGLDCTRKIRSNPNPEIAETPIIAITGNAMNYSEEDFLAVGINEYLPKPINFDVLLALIKKWTN